MIAIVGSASSAASKVALIVPPRTRASRRASAFRTGGGSRHPRGPSVFTTRAPSIDSWATALTSPMRSCAVWAGSSMRRAKIRFITASEGNTMRPTSASHGSVSSSATSASTRQHDHAHGERHRPEHVDRGLHVGLHVRQQLARGRLAVVAGARARGTAPPPACAGSPSPARPPRPSSSGGSMMPSARPTPPIISAATAIHTFEVSSVPSNAGCEHLVGGARRAPGQPQRGEREQHGAGHRGRERLRVHAHVGPDQPHAAAEDLPGRPFGSDGGCRSRGLHGGSLRERSGAHTRTPAHAWYEPREPAPVVRGPRLTPRPQMLGGGQVVTLTETWLTPVQRRCRSLPARRRRRRPRHR